MKLNLMNKQKIDSYFMNLSCEEINYLYETYFNKPKEAINYTRCCETLPNSKEPISLIIKQIEENANRIIEEVKQVNKFTVNKKTIEEMTKLNRLR